MQTKHLSNWEDVLQDLTEKKNTTKTLKCHKISLEWKTLHIFCLNFYDIYYELSVPDNSETGCNPQVHL